MSRKSYRLATATAETTTVSKGCHVPCSQLVDLTAEAEVTGTRRSFIDISGEESPEVMGRKRNRGSQNVQGASKGCHDPCLPVIDLTDESDDSNRLHTSSLAFQNEIILENPGSAVPVHIISAQNSDEEISFEASENGDCDSDMEGDIQEKKFNPFDLTLKPDFKHREQPKNSSWCMFVSGMNCMLTPQSACMLIGTSVPYGKPLTEEDFLVVRQLLAENGVNVDEKGVGPADFWEYLVKYQYKLGIERFTFKEKLGLTFPAFLLPDERKAELAYILIGKQTTDPDLRRKSYNRLIGRRVIGSTVKDEVAPESVYGTHDTLNAAKKLFREWHRKGMKDNFGAKKDRDYTGHAICVKFNCAGVPHLYDPGKILIN